MGIVRQIFTVFPEGLNDKTINTFLDVPGLFAFKSSYGANNNANRKINHQENYQRKLREAGDFIENSGSVATDDTPYGKIKEKILAGAAASDLLGLTVEESRKSPNLVKAFKSLSLYVHPDKNANRAEEAKVLFLCLKAAQDSLMPA